MKILNQFESLVIEDVKESNYACAHHSHTYYELVYIHEGMGIHHLNDQVIPYEAGDLFLIAPGEHHNFEIEHPTHFTYIKFTESYFESKKHLAPDEFKIGSPEILMEMKWLKEVKICIKEPCNDILRATVNNLIIYSQQLNVSTSPIVYYQLLSVFGMIREILRERNIHIRSESYNFEQLTSYLHEHIYDRKKLTIKNVANKFNISPTYFSNYFKRHFGVAYQEYLDNYRVSLIEKRLLIGGLKLKQIALEFGFTDTSHLSKTFKRVKGIAPQKYLKQNITH